MMDTKKSSDLRTWITCATYSLLNTIQMPDIDLIELENATGVSFGISSCGERYHYTRMLTPYCTFWDGTNTVFKAFGIKIHHHSFTSKDDLIEWLIRTDVLHVMIGPINMSHLTYLPLSSQYKCADHYITLHFKDGKTYLTDSEGIPYMNTNIAKLSKMLDISDIMEARGAFNSCSVNIETEMPPKAERRRIILENARKNIIKAEETGQGGNAFICCAEIMKNVNASKWLSSLQYDLSYYLQRKYMFLMADTGEDVLSGAFKCHIMKQINLIRQCLHHLFNKDIHSSVSIMSILANEESIIPELWKGWIK